MRAFLLSSSAVVAIAVVVIATVLSLSDPDTQTTGGADRPAEPSLPDAPIDVPPVLSDEVKAAALGGWVRTPDDEPVAGATVKVFRYEADTGRSVSPIVTVSTDRSGRFGVPGHPSGTWLIEASARGHSSGYAILRSFVEDEPVRLELRVHRRVTLAGRVLTTRSEPVARAALELRPARVVRAFHLTAKEFAFCAPAVQQSTMTDDTGAFRFDDLPPGIYDCQIKAAEMVPETVHTLHAPAEKVEILLRRGQTLRGTVAWPAGMTLPSVTIRTVPGGLVPKVELGKQGARFTIRGAPPGVVDVLARGRGTSLARASVTLEDGVTPPDVHLTLGPGTVVAGRVMDADTGKPLAGVAVSFEQDGDVQQVTTDARGWYRVLLPTGEWDAAISKPGYLDSAMRSQPGIEVGAEDKRRDFRMRQRLAIAGRVVYTTGEPASAWVQVADAQRIEIAGNTGSAYPPSVQGVRTDEHGRFRIEGVVRWAVYKVRAIGSGKRNFDEADEVIVPADAREVEIRDLRIAPPRETLVPLPSDPDLCTVRGRLVDGERRSIGGGVVSFHGIPATTGIDGRFQIPGVRSGRRAARAMATGFASTTFGPVRVKTGVDLELGDLVLPTHGALVSGRVLDRGAEPIAHARMRVGFAGMKGEFELTSDDFGRYAIEGPSAGRINVSVAAEASGHSHEVVHDIVITERVIDVVLPRHATLTGALVFTGAAPSIVLVASRRSGKGWPRGWTRTSARLEHGDRRLICDRLTAGDYEIHIEAPGYAPAKLGRVTLGEGRVMDIGTVKLTRGATLIGTVTVRGRVGPAGLTVDMYRLGLKTQTGKGGRFLLKNLPPGTWRILVWPGTTGTRPGYGLVRLTEGEQTKVSIDLK